MIIGIPRERFIDETRVAVSPAGARALIQSGATVYIETNAGRAAGWLNSEYEKAGATIAFSEEEAMFRADLVVKVLPPDSREVQMLQEGATLVSYLQLPRATREVFDSLIEREITTISLENIYYEGGGHPVRRAMSDIAGQLAVHAGSEHLRADRGGRGVLLGGLPGVASGSVGILGAGMVGQAAAAVALNLGAHVIIVDQKIAPLRQAMNVLGSSLQTGVVNEYNIEKMCGFVDVLICAIMIEDHPTPHLLMRENIRAMKRGSVLVDVAIDQGGSAETCRPTTISNPTYIEEDVVHYCVPNMPALVPRSATRAFQNQVLPLVKLMLRDGVVETLRDHPYLNTGLSTFKGKVVRRIVADVFGVERHAVDEVLQ